MVVGVRSNGANNRKTAALVKYSIEAVVKVFKDRTVSWKTASERASCCRQRLVNARAKRRVARLVQDNCASNYCISLYGILSNDLWTHFVVHYIVWDMGANVMFEHLCGPHLTRETVYNSHRDTNIGRSSIGKKSCSPMNNASICIIQLVGWERMSTTL